ncbi:MAG: hypothetical protein EWV53_11090 [Microcystis panniformis Mp_MB_F_20051200_S9]|uniref:Uncharacterized protein n=1 Tax=Microcystis panniformis Mp_MB_F_20051200_S9 TaxID=2486223 RepID=A0A552PYV7_9CHRO|nr:MAG: hypothetical protein EWV42_13095 [Microcystis panniformis Mp_GB_SS_20050300_S99D]TRV49387.1 MAG: hypothetical protein EWV43_08605 [Microcystis panniformis Mp_MB_F_20080800_S26D]TRV52808.1 MAG: hypothetical protein EWV87_04195 [Microcystis panniformis Mp_GB_SS_20050300_S99]TRV57728.1 MAG: hypothetical protein EWV69_15395 [Microcystis panniformis Mp_MB_F_20080800_S26]TRV62144.1 MAG: hypothetical protein EWV53_11090 [Microcystis panniformis Mp_MB_F_20051200_S9]TRV65595.1 MAG: hypothetical
MTIIHIHEFSTGILVDGTGIAGEWKSRGFSGEYMNSTLATIPTPVQLAIKNREFAVAEGASSQNPAIIGREVEYHGEAWSVIAVVTRGMDERGRGASLYRYFLCEGRGKLLDLVSWYMRHGKPTFNPSDYRQVGDPTKYNYAENKIDEEYIPPELQNLLQQKTPIIIPQQESPQTALIIHKIASKIASKTDPVRYNELISWACNVEALERPNRFLVIYPASKKAEETIRATINSVPQLPPAIPEETLIKTAIKNACRTGGFVDNLATIESALNNPKIKQNYSHFWNHIFEGEGSNDAYQQGIYNEPNVRLLTLQAIICPKKLPDFVDWIMKREKDYYPTSQSFQQEIVQAITQPNSLIFNSVKQGINILILNVIKQPELIDATARLLSDKQGLWRRVYKTYTSVGLKQDLKKKAGYLSTETEGLKEKEFYVLNDVHWQEIRDDLRKVWNRPFYPDQTTQKYIHLAGLFDKLEVPSNDNKDSLTVFFYHLAQGKIPSDVYESHKLKGDEDYNFGIKVNRDIPWYEQVLREIKETAIFLLSSVFKGGAAGCVIAIFYFLLIFTLGGFFFQRLLNLTNLSVPGLPGGSNNSESPISQEAIGSFLETKESLLQIQKDLKQTTKPDSSNPTDDEISQAILKILSPNDSFKLKTLNETKDNKDKEKWILSILSYQLYKVKQPEQNGINGIINPNKKTYRYLKCNLLQNMKLQASQETAESCKEIGFSKVLADKDTANPKTPSPSPSPTKAAEEAEAIQKAIREFDNDKQQKTKFTLETLVKELDNAFSLSPSSSSSSVIKVLDPNNEIGLVFSNMTEAKDKEDWVKAILKYQESLKSRVKSRQSVNIAVDGIINYGKDTYNLLKCDVAAQLGETLSEISETPEICGKVNPIIDSSTPPRG